MFHKSKFILTLILIIVSSFILNAQPSASGHDNHTFSGIKSSNRGTPDVIFKLSKHYGGKGSFEHLDLELPTGASFEHIGDGIFHITGMPDTYGPYSIKLKAGGSLSYGVSTMDISLIHRHLLGFNPLTNEYKLIAADVNCDGRISVLDIVEIKRVILDKLSEFGCKTNYKFVPENLEFEWNGSTVDAGEYIPIKLGDVSGNASANSQD